jgi:hypothetical protein
MAILFVPEGDLLLARRASSVPQPGKSVENIYIEVAPGRASCGVSPHPRLDVSFFDVSISGGLRQCAHQFRDVRDGKLAKRSSATANGSDDYGKRLADKYVRSSGANADLRGNGK